MLIGSRYRLAKRVGRGATADVWRAHDELLDRDVAIKLFRDHNPIDVEARLTALVRDPNVVAVHDLVPHRGSARLVMDYHPGVSLAELLRGRRRLPPPVVAALGLQLSAALEAVREAGVVHCDVKPANLMITDNGRPDPAGGVSLLRSVWIWHRCEVLGTDPVMEPECCDCGGLVTVTARTMPSRVDNQLSGVVGRSEAVAPEGRAA
ncbi:hypothetical protein GCM10023320_81400 [Pseudonocardia adelaidensis]|uniref:non-specific serine/threonine protein kinase n=1 Tax=Pseudonocardia adelaidensis TaxID=648754 RepID=A0ABP9PBX6_9PSEU